MFQDIVGIIFSILAGYYLYSFYHTATTQDTKHPASDDLQIIQMIAILVFTLLSVFFLF